MWQMLKHRLGALIGRRRLEQELDDELAFHRAMAAERGSGRRFGNDIRIRESAREQWMIARLEHLRQDLRYAARALRRSPAFTAGVVVTLALGIGATSAIFGLAYGVLWQPLPYPAAARIVELRQGKGPQQQMMNSSLDVVEARQRATGLDPWVLYRGDQATLTGAGEPAFLGGAVVESEFWSILGVKPLLGRLTLASDDRAAAAPVIVISEQLWRSHFGALRGVVGERVVLDGEAATIVGVAPAWFHFPGPLLPFETGPLYWHSWQQAPEEAGDRDVASLARLAPGATLASVQVRLDTAMRALAGAHPADRGWRFQLTPLREKLVGEAAPALELMLAVVLAVMLIAAINIACLLLARAERRQQELATRVALGASRGRIARQLLTEAGLLAVGGLAAGFGVALAGIAWLRAAAPA
ncbi:MAG: ABC transporter permease, partial [Terriglobales bacterium]